MAHCLKGRRCFRHCEFSLGLLQMSLRHQYTVKKTNILKFYKVTKVSSQYKYISKYQNKKNFSRLTDYRDFLKVRL